VQWRLLLDTARDEGNADVTIGGPTATYVVTARSLAVFNGRSA
jgi:hypothetical protein